MAGKRKYEVKGEDENGDFWVVGTDLRDAADYIAGQFRKKGYKNVRVVENWGL